MAGAGKSTNGFMEEVTIDDRWGGWYSESRSEEKHNHAADTSRITAHEKVGILVEV